MTPTLYCLSVQKLCEGISIRYKTILQLQSQVNHATSYLLSRIQPTNSSDISSACSLFNELVHKLTSLADKIPFSATPSVSVYNNWHDLKSSATVDKSTQTSHLNSSDTSSNSITPQTNLSVRIESAIETFNKETQNSSSLCIDCGQNFPYSLLHISFPVMILSRMKQAVIRQI